MKDSTATYEVVHCCSSAPTCAVKVRQRPDTRRSGRSRARTRAARCCHGQGDGQWRLVACRTQRCSASCCPQPVKDPLLAPTVEAAGRDRPGAVLAGAGPARACRGGPATASPRPPGGGRCWAVRSSVAGVAARVAASPIGLCGQGLTEDLATAPLISNSGSMGTGGAGRVRCAPKRRDPPMRWWPGGASQAVERAPATAVRCPAASPVDEQVPERPDRGHVDGPEASVRLHEDGHLAAVAAGSVRDPAEVQDSVDGPVGDLPPPTRPRAGRAS